MMTPGTLTSHEQDLDDLFGCATAYQGDLRLRTLDLLLEALMTAWMWHTDALDVAYQLDDQGLIRKLTDEKAWVMRMHASVTRLRRDHILSADELAAFNADHADCGAF